jgi:hypothetical protein
MTKEEIIAKINKSKNKPALMVDNERNIKAVVIKLEDLEEEKNVTLNDNVNYYEFDILAIDIQEWDEKSRDEAGLETIAVKDIISFYSSEELIYLMKNMAIYQKKNIEEDEAIARAVKVNCDKMSIFVPKDKIN